MNKEQIKEYTARVAQANRSELVVIIYELLLDSVREAKEYYASGDKEQGNLKIRKAQAYLQELKGSLDHQYELSSQLYELYRYVNEQFLATRLKEKPINLDSAERVIQGLMSSFEEVAKQDCSDPVLKNSQQIYAGLTYGKGALNEVLMNQGERSQGYKA